jgi:hypothetical protein
MLTAPNLLVLCCQLFRILQKQTRTSRHLLLYRQHNLQQLQLLRLNLRLNPRKPHHNLYQQQRSGLTSASSQDNEVDPAVLQWLLFKNDRTLLI